LRYLILGGGSVVAEYYLPALRALGRGDVVVVEPDTASRDALRARHPDTVFADGDYIDVLDGLALGADDEAIVVALPNALHVDAVRRALRRGRHVLCEKPLSLQSSDCRDLAAAAEAAGRVLKVAMSRRYLPSLMLAGEMTAAGELGRVLKVEVHDCGAFMWRPRSYAFFAPETGGILADMGVHYLDFLDTLVGGLKPVSYHDDSRGGAESTVHYALKAGKVDVDLWLSRLGGADEYMRIVCEGGVIRVDKSSEGDVLVEPSGAGRRRVTPERPFEDAGWPRNFHGSFRQMIADFERSCRGEPSRIADVAAAERAARLIEWAYGQGASRTSRAAAPTVLVTGATGFIGGHLVDRLVADGASVRATVRSPASCANLARYPVELAPTNLLDRESARRAVAGVRQIFHLAYGTDGRGSGVVTVDGTKNLVEAAIEEGVECVVVLSTMYVFGFPNDGRAVDESRPYRPYGGEYADSKSVMERWCLERARTSGATRVVVLNPTCVFGPGGGAYTRLPVELARTGRFCWFEEGRGYCNYTYVENLLDAMFAAVDAPAAHGERFIINDGVATWREFLTPILGPYACCTPSYSAKAFKDLPRYGGPFRIRDLAAAAAASAEIRNVAKRSAGLRRAAKLVRGLRPPSTALTVAPAACHAIPTPPPEWLADLFPDVRVAFSAEKANRTLNWRPKVPLAQAQAETIAWLQRMGSWREPAS
jgi:predicted dehydrogenase/nucleoside-diphosphate-sugar epimerase